jgi:hypothetical protein
MLLAALLLLLPPLLLTALLLLIPIWYLRRITQHFSSTGALHLAQRFRTIVQERSGPGPLPAGHLRRDRRYCTIQNQQYHLFRHQPAVGAAAACTELTRGHAYRDRQGQRCREAPLSSHAAAAAD